MRFGKSAIYKLMGLGIGLVICGGTLRAAPPPDAAALFNKNCSMCHRADGKGFPALKTPDFTDAKWQAAHADGELAEAIKNGRKGTPMPAFGGKLSDEEIHSLVRYVRTFSAKR